MLLVLFVILVAIMAVVVAQAVPNGRFQGWNIVPEATDHLISTVASMMKEPANEMVEGGIHWPGLVDEMNDFARVNRNEIVISPPFTVRLGALASLPTRETPLYISEQSAMFSTVHLRIKLPDGARVVTNLVSSTSNDGTRSTQVKDRVEQDMLVFDRVVGIPAGRIQPDAYPMFQGFVREAETALRKDIVISLGQR